MGKVKVDEDLVETTKGSAELEKGNAESTKGNITSLQSEANSAVDQNLQEAIAALEVPSAADYPGDEDGLAAAQTAYETAKGVLESNAQNAHSTMV